MELQERKETRYPLDDAKIIELYWSRNEAAIDETDFKYRKHLFYVAYHILGDRLDCEESINDTYLGAWNAIPPQRPNALKACLTTVMRRIAINRYHSKRKKSAVPSEMTVSLSELEDFISDDGDPSADFDAARLGHILSDFLRTLSDRRRFIFMSRYYMAEPIDQIAKELHLSRSMVNKELAAIRSALKETLESEGYIL